MWENKKDAYDGGFDDGLLIGIVVTLLAIVICALFIVGVTL